MTRATAIAPRPTPTEPEDDLQRRERRVRHDRPRRMEHRCSDGDRLTLEQRVSRVWEGLIAAGAAECPVCDGPMERQGAGGRCASCGAALW